MINFVNTGADEAILKSMSTDGCSEELIKSMSKQGLVQKDVTVQGKNGKTFTRKQWVKASDVPKKSDTGVRTNTGDLVYNGKTISKVRRHGEIYYKVNGENQLFSKETDAKLFIDKSTSTSQTTSKPDIKVSGQNKKSDNSSGDDHKLKSWYDKVQSGNFTPEQKKELEYGVSQRYKCLLQKDGKIKTAKDWDEADYAETKGWKNLGSLTGILNAGKLPTQSNSQTNMKKWVLSGVNYKGTPITTTIEAKTKSAALNKFNQDYGNIASVAGQDFASMDFTKMTLKELEDVSKEISEEITYAGNMVHSNSNKPAGQLNSVTNKDWKKRYDDLIDLNGTVLIEMGKRKQGISQPSQSGNKPKIDQSQPTGGKTLDPAHFDSIKSDKAEALKYLKDCGLNWTESSHSGINWMRAMAAYKTATSGQNSAQKASTTPTSQPAPQTAQVAQNPQGNAGKLSKEDAKKKTQSYTSKVGKSEVERKAFMDKVKAQGITWKDKADDGSDVAPAVNWMRCCMAMNKHFAEGGNFDDSANTNTTNNMNYSIPKTLSDVGIDYGYSPSDSERTSMLIGASGYQDTQKKVAAYVKQAALDFGDPNIKPNVSFILENVIEVGLGYSKDFNAKNRYDLGRADGSAFKKQIESHISDMKFTVLKSGKKVSDGQTTFWFRIGN